MNNLTRHEKLAVIFIISALAFSFMLKIVLKTNQPAYHLASAATKTNRDFAKVTYKININTATKKELESLKGIGPVLADRIMAYRTENGSFTDTEELKKIKGISGNILNKIKDKIYAE